MDCQKCSTKLNNINICPSCGWEKKIFVQELIGKNAACERCRDRVGDKKLKKLNNNKYCDKCYSIVEIETKEKKEKDKVEKVKLRRGNRSLKEVIKDIMSDGKVYSVNELSQILINDGLTEEKDTKKVKILVSQSVNSLAKDSILEKVKKGIYKMIIVRKRKDESYGFLE